MSATWGNRFLSPDNEKQFKIAIDEWAKGCYGITEEKIDAAFNLARDTMDFAPSIAEFKKLALNLPKPAVAYELASAGDQFQNLLTSWEWSNLSDQDLKSKFFAKYDIFCKENLMRVSFEGSQNISLSPQDKKIAELEDKLAEEEIIFENLKRELEDIEIIEKGLYQEGESLPYDEMCKHNQIRVDFDACEVRIKNLSCQIGELMTEGEE